MKVVTVAADTEPRVTRTLDVIARWAEVDVGTAAVVGDPSPSLLYRGAASCHADEANAGYRGLGTPSSPIGDERATRPETSAEGGRAPVVLDKCNGRRGRGYGPL